MALAASLVIAVILVTAWLINGSTSRGSSAPIAAHESTGSDGSPSGGPSRASGRSTTAAGGGSNTRGPGSAKADSIQVTTPVAVAKPFQSVAIRGTQPGAPDTDLHVQRREDGKWVAFPLPTQTDQSGQFATYVELNEPGQYMLRVVDPESGVSSDVFPLTIKR